MKGSGLTLSFLLIWFQFSASISSVTKAWERFMSFSCEFSSDVENVLPPNLRRSKRSIMDEDPNFNNPQELFAYLYPLADLKPEDFLEESQRSSSGSSTNSFWVWVSDLGSLWLEECKSHSWSQEKGKDHSRTKSG